MADISENKKKPEDDIPTVITEKSQSFELLLSGNIAEYITIQIPAGISKCLVTVNSEAASLLRRATGLDQGESEAIVNKLAIENQ